MFHSAEISTLLFPLYFIIPSFSSCLLKGSSFAFFLVFCFFFCLFGIFLLFFIFCFLEVKDDLLSLLKSVTIAILAVKEVNRV